MHSVRSVHYDMQAKRDEAIAECVSKTIEQLMKTMFEDFPKVFVYTALEMLGLVNGVDESKVIKNTNFGKNINPEDLKGLSSEELNLLSQNGINVDHLTQSEVEVFTT